MYDQIIKNFITLWFWPYFVIGTIDEWTKLGITLNGVRPINLCQPGQTKQSKPEVPQI